MIRWVMILMLALGAAGCESTHSYTYYEVVRSSDNLRVGDEVKIETRDKVSIVGTVVRVTDQEVVVTNEREGRRRVPWTQILTVQRVIQKQVIEEY